MKLIPLGARVMIKQDVAPDKTPGGILLPDSAKDKPAKGKIVGIGDGVCQEEYGTLKPGDTVYVLPWTGNIVKIEDEEFLIMKVEDLLAVCK